MYSINSSGGKKRAGGTKGVSAASSPATDTSPRPLAAANASARAPLFPTPSPGTVALRASAAGGGGAGSPTQRQQQQQQQARGGGVVSWAARAAEEGREDDVRATLALPSPTRGATAPPPPPSGKKNGSPASSSSSAGSGTAAEEDGEAGQPFAGSRPCSPGELKRQRVAENMVNMALQLNRIPPASVAGSGAPTRSLPRGSASTFGSAAAAVDNGAVSQSHLLWKLEVELQLARQTPLFDLFVLYCDYHNIMQLVLKQSDALWAVLTEARAKNYKLYALLATSHAQEMHLQAAAGGSLNPGDGSIFDEGESPMERLMRKEAARQRKQQRLLQGLRAGAGSNILYDEDQPPHPLLLFMATGSAKPIHKSTKRANYGSVSDRARSIFMVNEFLRNSGATGGGQQASPKRQDGGSKTRRGSSAGADSADEALTLRLPAKALDPQAAAARPELPATTSAFAPPARPDADAGSGAASMTVELDSVVATRALHLLEDLQAHEQPGVPALLDLLHSLLTLPPMRALDAAELKRVFHLLSLEIVARMKVIKGALERLLFIFGESKDTCVYLREWLAALLHDANSNRMYTREGGAGERGSAAGPGGAGDTSSRRAQLSKVMSPGGAALSLGHTVADERENYESIKRQMGGGNSSSTDAAARRRVGSTVAATADSRLHDRRHTFSSLALPSAGDGPERAGALPPLLPAAAAPTQAEVAALARRETRSNSLFPSPEEVDNDDDQDGGECREPVGGAMRVALLKGGSARHAAGGKAPAAGPVGRSSARQQQQAEAILLEPSVDEVGVWFDLVHTMHTTGVAHLKPEHLVEGVAATMAAAAAPVELEPSSALQHMGQILAEMQHDRARERERLSGRSGGSGSKKAATATPASSARTAESGAGSTSAATLPPLSTGSRAAAASSPHAGEFSFSARGGAVSEAEAERYGDLGMSLFCLQVLGHNPLSLHLDWRFSLQEVLTLFKYAVTLCAARQEETHVYEDMTLNALARSFQARGGNGVGVGRGAAAAAAVAEDKAQQLEVLGEQAVDVLMHLWRSGVFWISAHQLHDVVRTHAPALMRSVTAQYDLYMSGRQGSRRQGELAYSHFIPSCYAAVFALPGQQQQQQQQAGAAAGDLPSAGVRRASMQQQVAKAVGRRRSSTIERAAEAAAARAGEDAAAGGGGGGDPALAAVAHYNEYRCADVQSRFNRSFMIMAVCYESVAQHKEREAVSLWNILTQREANERAAARLLRRHAALYSSPGAPPPSTSAAAAAASSSSQRSLATAAATVASSSSGKARRRKIQSKPGYHLNERVNPLWLPVAPPAPQLLSWLENEVRKRNGGRPSSGGAASSAALAASPKSAWGASTTATSEAERRQRGAGARAKAADVGKRSSVVLLTQLEWQRLQQLNEMHGGHLLDRGDDDDDESGGAETANGRSNNNNNSSSRSVPGGGGGGADGAVVSLGQTYTSRVPVGTAVADAFMVPDYQKQLYETPETHNYTRHRAPSAAYDV